MICRQFLPALLVLLSTCALPVQAELPPEEVRQTAADAYVYGRPLVDNYCIYYAFAVNGNDTVSKNPADANSPSIFDSPYKISALDLRAQPLVVTLPSVGPGRIWKLQLIDFYTRDFEQLESVTVPEAGGCVLVAGPNWNGTKPPGCAGLLRARSTLALAVAQIRLQTPTDLKALNQERPNFKTEPLATYLGQLPPASAHSIVYLEPLSATNAATNLEFFNELAFLLQFCPPRPDDAAIHSQLPRLGLEPGRPFGAAFMRAAERAALTAGLADGQRILATQPPGKSFAQVFGTPGSFEDADDSDSDPSTDLSDLSHDGAFEIPFTVDSGGHLLDGSQGRYSLTFAPGQLPPAAAGWSLAMLSLPDQEPVKNANNRYFISSEMLPGMVRGDDGSLTLYIQHDPPGGEQNANWLPAPDAPFLMILRLYGAEQPVLDNNWQRPPVELVTPRK